MSVKLLTKQHLEFLSFKGSCTGSSESTLVKMPHCWKSHVVAPFFQVNFKLTIFSLVTTFVSSRLLLFLGSQCCKQNGPSQTASLGDQGS